MHTNVTELDGFLTQLRPDYLLQLHHMAITVREQAVCYTGLTSSQFRSQVPHTKLNALSNILKLINTHRMRHSHDVRIHTVQHATSVTSNDAHTHAVT